MEKYLKEFNQSNTLLVLSSFPQKRGEVAVDNAVARYSHLLVTHFPQYQKVVVICEKRSLKDRPYKLAKNILIIPSYKVNCDTFVLDVIRSLSVFGKVKNLHVQFEFSIFGGKKSIPQIMTVLLFERLRGRFISIMLHQVVADINTLYGHLGLTKNGLAIKAFNALLRSFYFFLGVVCDRLLVHDNALKDRLSLYVPGAKIAVVAHGMDGVKKLSKSLRQKSQKRLGLTEKDRVVTVFGYRSWYKGTDWIVARMGNIVKKYPGKRIKLLLAGGVSPTLKDTGAYQKFDTKLNKLVKDNQKVVIETGFVPERQVEAIYAASDIIVFPYRAKMSASGALSLAWQYGIPFLVSKDLSLNLKDDDIRNIFAREGVKEREVVFDLKTPTSFENRLFELFSQPSLRKKIADTGREIAYTRSWEKVGLLYLETCIKAQPVNADLAALKEDLAYAGK